MVRMQVSTASSKPYQLSPKLLKPLVIILFLSSILAFCAVPIVAQSAVVLVGSGSSVPAPLYNRWAQEYAKRNSHVQLRYLTVGTSEGIKQISHGVGDYGAGEAKLTDKERKDGNLIELPAVLIGIVPIYNLPDIHQELRLSGEVLAEIFLGDVKTWDSPSIAKLNPEVTLPNLRIQVVNRPAGKGSNYVFSDFLSKVSSKFRSQIGVTASPAWPVGVPAERSADMIERVKSEPGTIGFVESQYAAKGSVSTVAVLNASGKFVRASADTIMAACQSVEAPRWNSFAASLTNASGADSFPITSFSWVYVRAASNDFARMAALRDLLDWIYSDGQQFAADEGYSELPQPLLVAVKRKVQDLH